MVNSVIYIQVTGVKKAFMKFRKIRKNVPGAGREIIHTLATKSVEMAKRRVANAQYSKDGSLLRSIKILRNRKIGRGFEIIAGSRDRNAARAHYGTKPHVQVFPKGSRGARLARGWRDNTPISLPGGGSVNFHPGSYSQAWRRSTKDFMLKGFESALKIMPQTVSRITKKAILKA